VSSGQADIVGSSSLEMAERSASARQAGCPGAAPIASPITSRALLLVQSLRRCANPVRGRLRAGSTRLSSCSAQGFSEAARVVKPAGMNGSSAPASQCAPAAAHRRAAAASRVAHAACRADSRGWPTGAGSRAPGRPVRTRAVPWNSVASRASQRRDGVRREGLPPSAPRFTPADLPACPSHAPPSRSRLPR